MDTTMTTQPIASSSTTEVNVPQPRRSIRKSKVPDRSSESSSVRKQKKSRSTANSRRAAARKAAARATKQATTSSVSARSVGATHSTYAPSSASTGSYPSYGRDEPDSDDETPPPREMMPHLNEWNFVRYTDGDDAMFDIDDSLSYLEENSMDADSCMDDDFAELFCEPTFARD